MDSPLFSEILQKYCNHTHPPIICTSLHLQAGEPGPELCPTPSDQREEPGSDPSVESAWRDRRVEEAEEERDYDRARDDIRKQKPKEVYRSVFTEETLPKRIYTRCYKSL